MSNLIWKRVGQSTFVMELNGQIVNAVQTNPYGPDHVIWTYNSLQQLYEGAKIKKEKPIE